jgi:uncharacterized protein YegP (UPF0339 family)
VIGKSQMYTSTPGMEKGIQSVMKNAPGAETVDLTAADAGKEQSKKGK